MTEGGSNARQAHEGHWGISTLRAGVSRWREGGKRVSASRGGDLQERSGHKIDFCRLEARSDGPPGERTGDSAGFWGQDVGPDVSGEGA